MTLLWYDLETFGRNPSYDRIAQFAAVRTNGEFEIIEEPVVYYGSLSPDYLPDPMACLITGITPQEVNQKGLREVDLLKKINQHLNRPGTCTTGFNSVSFDDEFIRNLYYRNFYDPYEREWKNGNSRWDIINLARAAKDLRPEGINWPVTEDGRATVKLELLTEANGLSHEKAHDALSDVYATIAVAKLIREKQPRLFEWSFHHRQKKDIIPLIDLQNKEPLVFTSPLVQGENTNTTLVSPLVTDPNRQNVIYAFDLRFNPELLLTLSPEEIRKRIFTSSAELKAEGFERIPLLPIATNKIPFIAPKSVMGKDTAERLVINLNEIEKHRRMLQNSPDIVLKLREVYKNTDRSFTAPDFPDDPDFRIYSGFFPDEDRPILELIRNTEPENLNSLNIRPRDTRILEMLRRYIGRNYPETMNKEQQQSWKAFCANRLLFPPVPDATDIGEYRKRLRNWRVSKKLEADKLPVIKALEDYGDYLEKTILSSGREFDFS